MFLLNPSPTRFATHFILMMCTLSLKYSLRGTVHLQEFIALKLRKEEVTVSMIKDNQSFHQSHIFIKMAKLLLIIMRMDNSNQPHIVKLRLLVLMFDYHISMYTPDLNDKEYFPLYQS